MAFPPPPSRHDRDTKIMLWVAMGVAAALGTASTAKANCREPDPKLAWTYPADGQVDVPTNAVIWILSTLSGYPTVVTVDGTPVNPHSLPYAFAPGPLTPNTRHEVVVTHQVTSKPTSAELRFAFTTGAGPLTQASPVAAQGRAQMMRRRQLNEACQGVLDAGACYDTGQDTHLVVETNAQPLVWLMQMVPDHLGEAPMPSLWPATCASPGVFTHRQDTRCYNLIGANETGAATMSGPFCPEQPGAKGDQSQGCSAGGAASTSGMPIAIALGSLMLIVGRRRQPLVRTRRSKGPRP